MMSVALQVFLWVLYASTDNTQRNSANPFSLFWVPDMGASAPDKHEPSRDKKGHTLLGTCEIEKQGCSITIPIDKTSKSFSCLLHHTASLSGIFKHPWSTYQNIDLKLFRLVIQTTGNNNDHRSLDTRGPQDTSWGFTCAVAQAPNILSQSQHLGLPDQQLCFGPGCPSLFPIQANSPGKTHWAEPMGINPLLPSKPIHRKIQIQYLHIVFWCSS